MKIIGITGAIASGKTSASNYIRKKGFEVYDCDSIAHQIFELTSVKKEIASAFNIDIKDVNRKNIGLIVFNDSLKLDKLNAIMKERIIKEMKDIILKNNAKKLIFFDAPLLYDWHLEYLFDSIVFVYVPIDKQIQRLMERNMISLEYANKKISSQISIEDKLEMARNRCDYIIENNSTIDALYEKVDNIIKEIEHDI